MSAIRSAAAFDDPRIVEPLREYLDALEAGRRPDRAAFLARYPAIADALAECLEGLDFVHGAARSAPDDGVAEAAGTAAPFAVLGPTVPLGDYRIIREVGRGGMGVVYEAEQLSLGRRVALKVLPFASALDARQLQRFKNEAYAAANLHHTNIVPVFAIGYERGVHFYAMQFIEGRTLASIIDELRPSVPRAQLSFSGATAPAGGMPARPDAPAAAPITVPLAKATTERSIQSSVHFQFVARLGLQAAAALDHAHQFGIVHRDIKPANLLVDGRHNLWVTDFGLAHCQTQAGITMSGDLVGTLRYMSPEQALAQRATIDHRTDIYSLGVTLYELLTLAPAYPGRDRQELLRQIATEEPRSLRRLNSAIPSELETIVLKAIEKNPAERYATAKDLADDLGRYLRDEPIRAKRPTVRQRLWKWSRRHKGAVVFTSLTGALLLMVSVAILAVSNVVIERERREATRQRDDARTQRQLARQAVDKMFTQVAERWLSQQPHLEPMQREFLEEALHYYQLFAEDQSSEPELRLEASKAYRRVAEIQDKLGESAKANEAVNRAIALAETLAAEFPEDPTFRAVLAECRTRLGALVGKSDRPKEAEGEYLKSILLCEKLVAQHPLIATYRLDLCHAYSGLANIRLYAGRAEEAIAGYRQTLSLLESLPADLAKTPQCRFFYASSNLELGWALFADGHFRDAEESSRQAAAMLEKLVADFPNDAVFRHHFAHGLWWLGFQLATVRQEMSWKPGGQAAPQSTARSQEAEANLRRALAIEEKLVMDFKAVPDYRRVLADCHRNLGELLRATDRAEEAEKAFRTALQLAEQLVAEFPAAASTDWVRLMEMRFDLTCILLAHRSFPEIEEAHNKGLSTIGKLVTDFPSIYAFRRLLAQCHSRFGNVLIAIGRHREAEEKFRVALRLYDQLVIEAAPSLHNYRYEMFEICLKLESLQLENGKFQEAEQICRKSLALAERRAAEFPAIRSYRECLATSYQRLGLVLRKTARLPEAENALRRALDIWTKLAAELPTEYGRQLADCQKELDDLRKVGK